MHEMALAEGVIATALAAARQRGCPVRRVVARVGELQRVAPEVLAACLDLVRPPGEPLLTGTRIDLETEPARLCCRACGRAYGLDELAEPPAADELEVIHFIPELARAYVSCPGCASPDFDITAGRGVWIARLELEEA